MTTKNNDNNNITSKKQPQQEQQEQRIVLHLGMYTSSAEALLKFKKNKTYTQNEILESGIEAL